MSNIVNHNFILDLDSQDFYEESTGRKVLDFKIGFDHNYTIEVRKAGVVYTLPAGSFIEIYFDRINPVDPANALVSFDTLSFGFDATEVRYTNTFDTTLSPLNNTFDIEGARLRVVDALDGAVYELDLHVNFRNASLPSSKNHCPFHDSIPQNIISYFRNLLSYDNLTNKPTLVPTTITIASLTALFSGLSQAAKWAFMQVAGIPRFEAITKAFPEDQNFVEFDLAADLAPLGANATHVEGGSVTKVANSGVNMAYERVDTTQANPRIYANMDAQTTGANTATLLLRII